MSFLASSGVMQHNLKLLRQRRGWRLEDAAKAFGMSPKGYEKLEYSERKLSLDRIAQASEIYNVAVADVILPQHEIPIVGTVSHGGTVAYGIVGDAPATAPRPQGATSATIALLVAQGVTVPGIAIENYLIYHDEKRDGVPPEHVGHLCIAEVEGGEIYIRRIYEGREPGRYDLVGVGFETMRDRQVKWSAILTWLKPR